MGPLAGAGDPLFWFYPSLNLPFTRNGFGSFRVCLNLIVFFVLWNVMVAAVKWYTQEFGYRAGAAITVLNVSGNIL